MQHAWERQASACIFQKGEEALLLPLSENNETVDLCALVSLVAKLKEPD